MSTSDVLGYVNYKPDPENDKKVTTCLMFYQEGYDCCIHEVGMDGNSSKENIIEWRVDSNPVLHEMMSRFMEVFKWYRYL